MFSLFPKSKCLITVFSNEIGKEQFSEFSEERFALTSKEFFPYDKSVLPIVTEEEEAKKLLNMVKRMAQEKEEIVWSGFSGKVEMEKWFVMLLVLFCTPFKSA